MKFMDLRGQERPDQFDGIFIKPLESGNRHRTAREDAILRNLSLQLYRISKLSKYTASF